jgi:hypothetical protein
MNVDGEAPMTVAKEGSNPDESPQPGPFDFSSTHTANLPMLLQALGASVVMTSYQASRMVVVRNDGEQIDTDLKVFPRPMGLAIRPDRLVLASGRKSSTTAATMPGLRPARATRVATPASCRAPRMSAA